MRTVVFLAVCLEFIAAAIPEKKIVCFITGVVSIPYLDPTLCTHLIYHQAIVKGGDVAIFRRWMDLPDDGGRDGFGQTNALRQKNPSLKTMISVNGAITEFTKCPQIVSNSTCLEKIADNIVQFTKRWGFDGMNLFWDFVNHDPGPSEHRQNIIELLKFLRTRCDREGLIMSAGMYSIESTASRLYNIPQISKYLHFINMMTVYYYNSWDTQTRIGAPLHARFDDNVRDKAKNVEASIMYWLSQGVLKDKLVVGITATGPTFTLANPNDTRVGAAVRGVGVAGPITRNPGFLGYNEVCTLQKSGGWKVVFDEQRRSSYTFKGDQWIAYDNVKSVREKAEFIARLNLGGAVLANADADDFRGLCGKEYPLLKTLNAVLRNGDPVPEESLPQRCAQPGYVRDARSCGLIMCVPNITGGFNEYYFKCSPGNCYNKIYGKIWAERIDANFSTCSD